MLREFGKSVVASTGARRGWTKPDTAGTIGPRRGPVGPVAPVPPAEGRGAAVPVGVVPSGKPRASLVRMGVLLMLTAASVIGCSAVDGPRILGSDLAHADQAYTSLPRDLVAGFAPLPGTRRILDPRTLAAIARANGLVVGSPGPLCFERRTVTLDETAIRPVLERVLGQGTRIEIVDMSRSPVPSGEVVFTTAELPRPSPVAADPVALWRGRVVYDGRSTVAIWAKVRVSRLERWVEPVSSIAAREKITAAQVEVKSGWRFPFVTEPLREVEQVIGKQVARSLRAGQPVFPALIEEPKAVEAGDPLDAEVVSGGVTLRFAAKANTGGHRDGTVLITATDTGKRYRAYVQEKGKVVIHADTRNNPKRTSHRDSGVGASGGNPAEETHSQGAGIVAGQVPE